MVTYPYTANFSPALIPNMSPPKLYTLWQHKTDNKGQPTC